MLLIVPCRADHKSHELKRQKATGSSPAREANKRLGMASVVAAYAIHKHEAMPSPR
jgi:hypothetical protein